jgi:hypothetical protein
LEELKQRAFFVSSEEIKSRRKYSQFYCGLLLALLIWGEGFFFFLAEFMGRDSCYNLDRGSEGNMVILSFIHLLSNSFI